MTASNRKSADSVSVVLPQYALSRVMFLAGEVLQTVG
jgi:phosphoribosylpyrophosphate synthetase